MSALSAELKGAKEVQQKLTQAVRDLKGPPILSAMRDATLLVTRSAKQNAPVDTGRLRASITPEVVTRWGAVQGIVGSNVVYAPYVELGTRPHWPPIAALEVWARRHGTSAFLVARAISRRGTKAILYLRRALDDNRDAIHKIFDRAVKRIVG